jgi:hypothetical protein
MVSIDVKKTLLEKQTYSWRECMKNIMEGSTKGKGALGRVDQGTMEDIEEDEYEIPNTQTFTPMPSNDKEEKDVPLPKTFVHTPKEGMNISPFAPKSVSCKLPRVSSKIA